MEKGRYGYGHEHGYTGGKGARLTRSASLAKPATRRRENGEGAEARATVRSLLLLLSLEDVVRSNSRLCTQRLATVFVIDLVPAPAFPIPPPVFSRSPRR